MRLSLTVVLLCSIPLHAEPPNVDTVGDPLPEGAVARFGSARLRGNRVIISPDGTKLVRESGGNLQISELLTGKPIATCKVSDLPGCESIVASTIGWSPDGSMIAAIAWKNLCGLWDTRTGQLIRSFEGTFFSMAQATISPDGKFLTLGKRIGNREEDYTVFIYDIATGKKRFELPGKIATFSSDSKIVVSHDPYGFAHPASWSATLPDGDNKTEWARLRGQRLGGGSSISGIVGDVFIEGTEKFAYAIRDIANGDVKHYLNDGEAFDESTTISVSAGHPFVIIASYQNSTLSGFDLKTGKHAWTRILPVKTYRVLRTADGEVLHVMKSERMWTTYDAKSGRELKQVRLVDNGQPAPTAITPDGKYGVSQSDSIFSSVACVWDLQTGKPLRAVPGHLGSIEGIAVSPDGKTAATVSEDRTVRTWDIGTGKPLSLIDLERPKYVTFGSDGKTLIAANGSGTVWTLDPDSGQILQTAKPFAKFLVGLSLLSDGQQIVVAGQNLENENSELKWLDAVTLADAKKSLRIEGSPAEQLSVSKDGTRYAVSNRERKIHVGNLKSGQTVQTIVGESARISAWVKPPTNTPFPIGSLTFSPTGDRIAFSDQEAGFTLYKFGESPERKAVKTGEYYQSPAARYELSDACAWSPDGRFVAYSGPESSRTVSILDPTTKTVVKKLTVPNKQTRSLAWTPDGRFLITGGSDGTALVWKIRTGE